MVIFVQSLMLHLSSLIGLVLRCLHSCSMLCLPLPHKIDDKQSSAKWVAKKKQLTLTMRIVRDH